MTATATKKKPAPKAPLQIPAEIRQLAAEDEGVAHRVWALEEANRYSVALCLIGDPFTSHSDSVFLRDEAIDALAKKVFRATEFRQEVLAKFPADDREDAQDGVLFPYIGAYRNAGYYIGIAVGLRMARTMRDGGDK